MKEEKAITLVTLAVTIIVLIILAGVSITSLVGDNGIITKAKQARENITYAGQEEQEQLNQLFWELEQNGSYTEDEEDDKKDEMIELLQKQVEELKQQVAELQGENTELKEEVENLNSQIEELNKQINDLKAEVAEKDIEIADLKEEIVLKQETINNLQEQLDSLNSQLAQTNATAAEILEGYKAYSGGKLLVGIMANNGAVNESLNAGQSYTIPAGYHNGRGKIVANSLASQTQGTATAEDITEGKIAYVNGQKIVGTAGSQKDTFSKLVTSANYGDYVYYPIDLNGDGNTSNDWRIFYNNGENIFIIAADYIKNTSTYLNNTGTGMRASTGNYINYGLYWKTALTTAQTVESSILNLFQQSWTNYNANNNAKCVSALLNTNNWNGFVNTSYANYAIGGPTVEMWVKSYREKGYTSLYTKTNTIGYCIGNTQNPTTTYYNLENDNGYNETLYFPYKSTGMRDGTQCNGYWIASPGASSIDDLMCVYCNGLVSNNNYNDVNLSVRPLVCLKADLKVTRDYDGIWRF